MPLTPLAKAYGPGLSRFVTKMNATARLLGMRRTHFSNFDGLPLPDAVLELLHRGEPEGHWAEWRCGFWPLSARW